MEKEDVRISWYPHTTSKLKEEVLTGIQSFGFRGEALASLAAVSTLTIKSRTKDTPVGFEVKIANSQLVQEGPVGMPTGTTIIAEHLFSALPVRKKFLKSPQTELRHIVDVITQYAAVFPHVHFILKHNKRILLDFPKTDQQSARGEKLLGENFPYFLNVKKEESYLKLSGWIAKPQFSSSTTSKQFLFVNNRKVTDRLISLAIKEAYGTMLEPTAYPPFLLFIEIPFEFVDVNIHPRKETVAFMNNQFIFQTIKQCITEVLQENNITFQNLSWKKRGVGTTNTFAAQLIKNSLTESDLLTIENHSAITQIHNLYLLVETKHGLVIVDQHAAHERILFEKLKKEFLQQKKRTKPFLLSEPVVLHLTPTQVLLVKDHTKLLKKLGYTLSLVSKDQTVVTHIPSLFQDRNPQELITQTLEDLEVETGSKTIDKISEEMLAFIACRSAVKAGDILTEKQMRKIIEELSNVPNDITCPHGRPTRIFLDKTAIDTWFKR